MKGGRYGGSLAVWMDVASAEKTFKERAVSIQRDFAHRFGSTEAVLTALVGLHHASDNLKAYESSALSRELPCGRFAAQVAIASGHGSASTARLMRFEDDFATGADAIRYAEAQGLSWAAERQGTCAIAAPAALHHASS